LPYDDYLNLTGKTLKKLQQMPKYNPGTRCSGIFSKKASLLKQRKDMLYKEIKESEKNYYICRVFYKSGSHYGIIGPFFNACPFVFTGFFVFNHIASPAPYIL